MIRVSLSCLWKAACAVCSAGDSYCMAKTNRSTGDRTGAVVRSAFNIQGVPKQCTCNALDSGDVFYL